MLFSYNWLKEYLENVPEPSELAERLTMTGTEIESVARVGASFSGVVTASILECAKHPNADKLSLCKVTTGSDELQIVCGAKNMKAGDRVALALAGAELPGGFKIKKSKIRGVESEGMMCSEVELGLKDASEGILILPGDTPLGVDFASVIGGDYMLEAGVTPNRADLLSIRGIARETAAVTSARFVDKAPVIDEGDSPIVNAASVEIDPGAPCRRYSCRVIEGLTIAQSPDGIRRRLEAHGIRPVNNVVDATNLVLLETGQPLHAFDLDTLVGGKVVVRLAREGECIETIDGKSRRLDPSMLVIADSSRPVAVAGVMGGKATEVTDSTTRVLLESAWFEPTSVRRTSRRLGLSSDSSYRFERGVDINGVPLALDMAAKLINRLAGGWVARGVVDAYPVKFQPRSIELRVERARSIIGAELTEQDILGIMMRLRVIARAKSPGVIEAVPPSHRGDLATETDLLEEAARIFGYNNIPTTLPVARLLPGRKGPMAAFRTRARALLADMGFTEVINYSFTSRDAFALTGPEGKKGIEILNPITEGQVVMRDTLVTSLLENLEFNLARQAEDVRIFECAPVFLPGGKLPEERWKVSGLIYGRRYAGGGWGQPKDGADFFDIKGAVEGLIDGLRAEGTFAPVAHALLHPGKSAALMLNGGPAGVLGELHPDLWARYGLRRPAFVFELDAEAVMKAAARVRKYSPLPRFPESTRDAAIVVDESVPFGDILDAIRGLDTKLIDKVELFDVYYAGNLPQGKRSLALRVTCLSRERTLTNEEVEDIHSRVIKVLVERFKAQLRG